MKKLCLLLVLAVTAGMTTMCSSSSPTRRAKIVLPFAAGKHPGIQVQFNLPVPMRDGVKLRADVYTPDGRGPFPVLLMRTPYNKSEPGTIEGGIAGAEHGFIMVQEDVRGRFASPGKWYPFKYEIQDGYDSVEWAAHLPKSNGKVGMFGGSYVGATQWLAAVSDPPNLAGIAPEDTPGDYYRDWAYQSGALQQWFVQSWASQVSGQELSRYTNLSFSAVGFQPSTRNPQTGLLMKPGQTSWTNPLDTVNVLPLKNYSVLEAPPVSGEAGSAALVPWYLDWLEHPTGGAYWQQWAIDKDYSRIKVPVFITGGWYDLFLGGTLRNYHGVKADGGTAAARNGVRMLLTPGGHSSKGTLVGAHNFGPAANVGTNAVWDWYDEILRNKPEKTAISSWKAVRYFQMGTDTWQMSDTWPPAAAKTVKYYLHSAGKANTATGNGTLDTEVADPADTAASDRFVYNPADPVPTLGGAMCCDGADVPNGVQVQNPDEKRPDVLVFSTPVLQHDLNVTGPVTMTLYVSSSAPDTDFTAVLTDVAPDGTSTIIADGIRRMRFRDGYTKPVFMQPGKIYKVKINLWATSNVFLQGQRLRVDVSSSNFPRWDRNLNTRQSPESGTQFVSATNVVYHNASDPSSLNLSVMPRQ